MMDTHAISNIVFPQTNCDKLEQTFAAVKTSFLVLIGFMVVDREMQFHTDQYSPKFHGR